MNNLENAITKVIIELIETSAILKELERGFTHMDGGFYYTRKTKLSRRVEELEAILTHSKIGWTKDAPTEQYLVIRS